MDPDLKSERRKEARVVKLKALIVVTGILIFGLALIVGDAYAQFDHFLHLMILAFMGVRVFRSGL
jgi:hypothetical protein